jgi:hypothetical protein
MSDREARQDHRLDRQLGADLPWLLQRLTGALAETSAPGSPPTRSGHQIVTDGRSP